MALIRKKAVCALAVVLCLFAGCAGVKQHRLQGAQPDAPVESQGGTAVIQGDWVYYLNGDNYMRGEGLRLHQYRGAICRMRRDGTQRELLCEDEVSLFYISAGIIRYAAREGSSYALYCINTDGTGRRRLCGIDNIYSGGGCEFTQEAVYYIRGGCLYKREDEKETRLTQSRVCNIKAAGDYIYYTAYDNEEYGSVCRIAKDDTEPETVSRDSGYVVGASGGRVYYYLFSSGNCYVYENGSSSSVAHLGYDEYCFSEETDYIFASYVNDTDGGGVYRIDTASGTRKLLAPDRAERMVYYDGWLYYINDSQLFSLWRVSPDGEKRECVCSDMISSAQPPDIADGYLYYFNDDDESRIYRLSLADFKSTCVEYEFLA